MKSSGIGGQAVLEGVMMKNQSQYAVAVRTPDGEIVVEKQRCKGMGDRRLFFRLPIIRGIVSFVDSLVLGMKTLTFSSSFYEEEGEQKKPEQSEDAEEKKKRERKEALENIGVVILSIVLAIGFFMLLPFFLSELLRSKINSPAILATVEGVLRIVLFMGYVMAISCMKDIKRVFMYHGAEHKTINCVENGLELNIENVKKQSCHHRRCGTSFLLLVMFISIIFFVFIQIPNVWLRMLVRILLVPIIAGVAYEFIQFAGNTEIKAIIILSKPGMLLQCLTTREPDEDMIEVAIASVEAVFDWREYQRRCKIQKERQKKSFSQKEKRLKERKSRAQIRRELEEREKRYRQKAKERELLLKEQEEYEAKLEKKYRDVKQRNEARKRDMAERLEPLEDEEDDILDGLNHFFDDKDPKENNQGKDSESE